VRTAQPGAPLLHTENGNPAPFAPVRRLIPVQPALLLVLLLAMYVFAGSAIARIADQASADRPVKHGDWCGTMPAYAIQVAREDSFDLKESLRNCEHGLCDWKVVRDATEVFPLTFRVIVHVMRDDNGTGGVSQQAVDETIDRMNTDYGPMNIQFINTATLYHDDSRYSCVPAYDSTGAWFDAIQEMKIAYAVSPEWACNIFVSCMEDGPEPLWGVGTFPWMSTALTAEGGIWLNSELSVGAQFVTPTHEMGHNLGLWHTHHGVDEVDVCGLCYEYASGFEGNLRGDYCKDTPPTPTNWTCLDPGGVDCLGDPWGATAYWNYMGYGPDDCCNEFTSQQCRRMHCWSKERMLGWIADPATAAPPPTADVVAFGLEASGPNPFSPGTTIEYSVPVEGLVQLKVYDVLGRAVRTLVERVQPEGRHVATWNGRDEAGKLVPAGVYLYRLTAGERTDTGKVVRVPD